MGSSNLLDGRPAPVAQIGQFCGCLMVVACSRCGKRNRLHIGRMIDRHRLDPSTRFHRLADRLRCATCGGEGQITGVEGWR